MELDYPGCQSNAGLFAIGLDYLYEVRALIEQPDLIDLVHRFEHRQPVCTWIGAHIEPLNAYLLSLVQACHGCFHPWQWPSLQVRAAPLADAFAIDGFCALSATPMTTIVLDVGRVCPQDWLALVAHEYTHALLGHPGHAPDFAETLSHLCRALDILLPPVPPASTHSHAHWQSLPSYRTPPMPLDFWYGRTRLPFRLS